MKYRRALACAVAVYASAGIAVPVAEAQQYSFRYYGSDQGLTNLAVKVLFQDRTGFLWVSTENGLFRYDGERFQEFGAAEGIPASAGVSLGEAPDGSLLAGAEFGLRRKNGDRFEPLPLPGAKSVVGISGIYPDGAGNTYIATEAGLAVATVGAGHGPLAIRLLPSPAGVSDRKVNSVFASKGMVWYGCGPG